MVRTHVIALTLFSVIPLAAMEGNNSQEESPSSSWLSTSTDFASSMFSASSSVLTSISGYANDYANKASRANTTYWNPDIMFGIGLEKEQADIEIKRTRAVMHAMHKKYNNDFLPSNKEEALSEGEDEGILLPSDDINQMYKKRIAQLYFTTINVIKQPNDINTFNNIYAIRNSMGSALPADTAKMLNNKEKCITIALQNTINQSMIIKSSQK